VIRQANKRAATFHLAWELGYTKLAQLMHLNRFRDRKCNDRR